MARKDYSGNLVKVPSWHPGTAHKNTTGPLIYMSRSQVPGVKYYVELQWVWGIPNTDNALCLRTNKNNAVFLHLGTDSSHPEELGADIEYNIGSQHLTLNSTSALFVPAGVPYSRPLCKVVRRPHVLITVVLGSGGNPESAVGSDLARQKGVDYERYLVRKPTYEVLAGTPVRNRQGPSSMTLMSNNLVAGSNIYIEGGWVWGMPDPNPHIFEHVHDYEEVVIHYGMDYLHPEELGAEIEFCVGGQPLTVDKTSAVFVPRGVPHGPLTWKKYYAPHLEMAIMPGAGTLAEADPGGHQEKMKRRDSQNA